MECLNLPLLLQYYVSTNTFFSAMHATQRIMLIYALVARAKTKQVTRVYICMQAYAREITRIAHKLIR